MIAAVDAKLTGLKLGEAQAFENITVFPLLAASVPTIEYVTLADAMEAKALVVTEVSETGSVPDLKVSNTGRQPVLLIDGEELAGAKQNRVLNATILFPANTELAVAVSCTEQGRWAYTSKTFEDSGVVMNRISRARKLRSVTQSLESTKSYTSDQGEVWDSVGELQAATGAESDTDSMRDVFEQEAGRLNKAADACSLVEGQKGIAVTVNGEVAGLDLVSRAPAYARLHGKLVKSYVMDVAIAEKREVVAEADCRTRAETFIADLSSCEEKRFESVGLGWDYRYRTDKTVGSALLHEEEVIHAAFFTLDEEESAGSMTGYRQRRSHRLF